jgi:hypothetical protein
VLSQKLKVKSEKKKHFTAEKTEDMNFTETPPQTPFGGAK